VVFPNGQWDLHFNHANLTMTTSTTLRGTAGTAAAPTPHKTIRSFFRETEDDIIDDPPTTNSNNTQNENTPTQPIPKTIGNNKKKSNQHSQSTTGGRGNSHTNITAWIQPT
jgi:hypothetical protein